MSGFIQKSTSFTGDADSVVAKRDAKHHVDEEQHDAEHQEDAENHDAEHQEDAEHLNEENGDNSHRYHVFYLKVPVGKKAVVANKTLAWHGELKFCRVRKGLTEEDVMSHLDGVSKAGPPEVAKAWWKCNEGPPDSDGDPTCKKKPHQENWDEEGNTCEVLTYGSRAHSETEPEEDCSGVSHYEEPLYQTYPWHQEKQHLYYLGVAKLPGDVSDFRKDVMCGGKCGAAWAAKEYNLLKKNCNIFAGSALQCLHERFQLLISNRPFDGSIDKKSLGITTPACPCPEHPETPNHNEEDQKDEDLEDTGK